MTLVHAGTGRPRLSLPPVTSVAASTYSTVAIAMDGRCYSWGDCDGGALGGPQ